MGRKKDGPPMNSGSLGWWNVTARSNRIGRFDKNIEKLGEILRGRPDLYPKVKSWMDKGWPVALILPAIQDEVETGKSRKRPAQSKS